MARSWSDDDLLALSGVQHYAFCPRQWALIHVEQQWAENAQTMSGRSVHERCHDETIRERRGELLIVRGLQVKSCKLGLAGVCDVVEFQVDDDGVVLAGEPGRFRPVPVEYKRGKRKSGNEDRVQVCAQAIALEEMFCCDITSGFLYYDAEKHREEVELTAALRDEVAELAEEMHKQFARGYTPKPQKKRRCSSCSLVEACAPALESSPSVGRYISEMIGEMEAAE